MTEGPWKYVQFTGSKSQPFQQFLEQQKNIYINSQEKLQGVNKDEVEILRKVKDMRKEKAQVTLAKAKAAAKAALVQQKALREAKPKAQAKASA